MQSNEVREREGLIMEQKFYICEHCRNIVTKIKDVGVPVVCCGEKMKELVPGTVDAAVEKHIPVHSVEGNLVKVFVGSTEHPSLNIILSGYLCRRNRETSGKH